MVTCAVSCLPLRKNPISTFVLGAMPATWRARSRGSFTLAPFRDLEARLGGWALRLRAGHQGPFPLLHPEAIGNLPGDGLNLYPDPPALDITTLLQLRNHRLHRCGRDV